MSEHVAAPFPAERDPLAVALSSLPPDIAGAIDSLPPLAVVHRMPGHAVDTLAAHWSAGTPDSEVHPLLARLGPAARRLRELQVAERVATTCPACAFDGLEAPPYLAFEGVPVPQEGTTPPAPPYAVHFGDPSGQRCPCCGYGFGIDDDPADGSEPITFESWARRWQERGRPGYGASTRPAG
ncbi:hypothetical protein PSU4_37600 [Pseudonocardia sulfidoxydans NBRC 16205]|uniref:Uncharacterized protein n=1 Tax=Pseudonocardia sulfidoxydans NBRC 16205 TaxID=1223511 RepID=A0A511DJ21_9PSEU|nr:hypothetical protein [Pseudonocardia sulfidoxydans]GEL24806.1 hypothetical protein PSU4_37600 [Pseudonocardia sulfidoxydans NBRC 16205]